MGKEDKAFRMRKVYIGFEKGGEGKRVGSRSSLCGKEGALCGCKELSQQEQLAVVQLCSP